MPTKILIGDDHKVIRKGLITYFQLLGHTDISEAASCSQIMHQLATNTFTHCVLDIHLPDGSILEILPNIQRLYPDIKLSIFSMQPVDIYRHALRHYGIRYYISKASMEDEMLDLFGKFLNNEPSPVDDFDIPETPFYRLSAREFEVLHYLLKGNTPVEIAATLNLSRQTVATLRSRILEKTNTESLQQLSELASLYNLN